MNDVAIQYIKRGFSVIPINPNNKKSFIKWEGYQRNLATETELRGMWHEKPNAMIGIITGELSGICVVDIDKYADDYDESIELEYFPDTLVTPTSQTPRGGMHLYFRYPKGSNLTINSRKLAGIDFRGEGGYIIAPPSKNSEGKAYEWMPGLSIDDVPLADLPLAYITKILNKHVKKVVDDNKRHHLTTNDNIYFTKGRRDEDLFSVANALLKIGLSETFSRNVLERLAFSCNPPFPQNEAQVKVDSALSRIERGERNLTQEIRDLFLTTNDNITTTFVYQMTTMTTSREEKKKALAILSRMVDEGFIQRVGNGIYRRVDTECEEIDFLNADDTILSIAWPFGIERLVQTMPKNIIVIAGEPNSGKTAFLLNLARLNMNHHPVYYFSSEMGSLEMKKRLGKFNMPLSEWKKIHAKERASNFADVIKPDAINIIDFLEVYDEFYKIGGMIREIYDKLKGGIAVIAIQKNRGTDYGLGGMRGLEKARLYMTMEPNRARIVKAKNWATYENPNGMTMEFNLVDGCKFIHGEWSQMTNPENIRSRGVQRG